jgi:hypothetical protein
MNHKFDELAKGLAQSVTRRQALRRFGVGLAGMALACFGLANKAKATTYTGYCVAHHIVEGKGWRLDGTCYSPELGCFEQPSADCTLGEPTGAKQSQCGLYVAPSKKCSFTL